MFEKAPCSCFSPSEVLPLGPILHCGRWCFRGVGANSVCISRASTWSAHIPVPSCKPAAMCCARVTSGTWIFCVWPVVHGGTAMSLLTQKRRNFNPYSASSSGILYYVHPGIHLLCCWVGDFHGFIQQHIMGCLTQICERWVSRGHRVGQQLLGGWIFLFDHYRIVGCGSVFSGVPQCVIFSTWAILVVGDFLIPIYFYI